MVKESKAKKKVSGASSGSAKAGAAKANSAKTSPSSGSANWQANGASGPASRSHRAGAEKLKEHQQNFTKKAKDVFEKVKGAAIDHKTVIAHHKKNLEVLNHAHKKTAEVMKSIANLQSQFVKQTFADLNSIMRGAMTKKPGQPADLSAHTDTIKNSFHRAVEHAHSVSSMISDSHKEIHAHVHERMEEGKEEVKAHIAKHTRH